MGVLYGCVILGKEVEVMRDCGGEVIGEEVPLGQPCVVSGLVG